MSEAASTSVDVLIARLESHPDEFFKREAVASYDGEKIFAHTKWRRITTTLLVNKAPDEQNLWIDLFSQDERQRFRDAIFKAVRAELDTQIMRVIVGEDPLKFDPDGQRTEEMKARQAAQMAIQQGYRGGIAAAGTAIGTGGLSLLQNSEQAKQARLKTKLEAEEEEESRASLLRKTRGWFSK